MLQKKWQQIFLSNFAHVQKVLFQNLLTFYSKRIKIMEKPKKVWLLTLNLLNKILDFSLTNGIILIVWLFFMYIKVERSVARGDELFRFHRRFHRPLTLDSFAKIQQPRKTVSEISIPTNSSDYLCACRASLVLLLSITGADYGRLWSVKGVVPRYKSFAPRNIRLRDHFRVGGRNYSRLVPRHPTLNFWHSGGRPEKRDDKSGKEQKAENETKGA